MAARKQRGQAGDKTLCLPIVAGIDYDALVEDREAYQIYLDQQIAKHPELFPAVSCQIRYYPKLSNRFLNS